MNKRLLSAVLFVLTFLAAFSLPAVAANTTAAISASYSGGIVTVSGTGFTGSAEYTIRVVNTTASSIAAMRQTTADGSGKISASITTGALTTLSDYTVYVNRQDGSLAAQDSSITAKSSGDSDNNNGNGGGKNSDVVEEPPVASETRGNTTTASAPVPGTTDPNTGKTTGRLNSSTAAGLVNSAKSAEAEGKKSIVEIKLETTEQTRSAEVAIPRDAFDQLASETNADVRINTGIGTVTFDAKAAESISGAQAAGDIRVNIAKVDTSTLPASVQQAVGDRPVLDLSVTAGGSSISSFGGGSASINIPYILRPGEDKNAIVVYYIDSSGNLQAVRGAYNEATGTVDLKVSHFSKYAVGYNKVTFADVSQTAWCNNAVTFIAARSITTGTAPGKFSPDAAITRGQFIVMLMRAYEIEPDQNPTNNFADAGNTYYTNYLAAAKRLGISTGVGNNNFAPDSEITRQDMFTLLYRSLDILGELPDTATGKKLSDFSDAATISAYAADAFNVLVKSGIVSGSSGKLDPVGQATRAQMAQILYNLLAV